MKPVTVALLVAALHRIAVVGIFALGFGAAMTAFNGNSPAVSLAAPLIAFSQLLDFPVFVMNYFAFRFKHGYFPQGGMFAIFANELPFRLLLSLVWSLCVGSMAGLLVARRRRRKYGPSKPRYW